MIQNTQTAQKITQKPYPSNQKEFNTWFHTEEACYTYLEQLRWPNGFRCPSCNHDQAWQAGDGRHKCSACRKITSLTSDTIFHKSRTPLVDWFNAAWLITEHQSGISGKQLAELLGMRMPTAWILLHRYRYVMAVANNFIKLDGVVEMDETVVGGTRHDGKVGRGASGKILIAIAAERGVPKGIGNIRMQVIKKASARELMNFAKEHVVEGSTVRTDGWRGYYQLAKNGYEHEQINISGSGAPAHVHLPLVHQIASSFDRWWLGTFHGAISPQHMDEYLAEFCFRFNRRQTNAPGELFHKLLEYAVAVPNHTHQQVVYSKD